MACGCGKAAEQRAVTLRSMGMAGKHMTSIPMEIRDGKSPLACWHCLVKHVAAACRQYIEFMEDGSREAERVLCIGNLQCAIDHAKAVRCENMVLMCKKALGAVSGRSRLDVDSLMGELIDRANEDGVLVSDSYAKMVGYLAAAEDYARMAGLPDSAEAIRNVRSDAASAISPPDDSNDSNGPGSNS